MFDSYPRVLDSSGREIRIYQSVMVIKKRIWALLLGFIVILILLVRPGSPRNSGTSEELSKGWLKPNTYRWGDHVELLVNKVESDLTQFPYGYYDLPFTCPPTEDKKPLHLSLNEIIRGDRKWESNYRLTFGQDAPCEALCARKTTPDGMRRAQELVRQGYVVQWMIDDELPAATTFLSTVDHKKYYVSGFPLGFVDPNTEKTYLNNHAMMVIRYHAVDPTTFTIVGFEVYPKSVSNYDCPGASKDYEQYEIIAPEKEDEPTLIPFTYSVYWREEFNVDWSSRWNFFLNSGELSEASSRKFHWITLGNSVGICCFLMFIVIANLYRIVKIGPDASNDDFQFTFDQNEDVDSIYGVARMWLAQTDPTSISFKILTIVVSIGVQFLFTIVGSLTFSCSLNKLHNIRNSVLSVALFFFVTGAFMASFVGTWLHIDHGAMDDGSAGRCRIFSILCGSALPGLVMISTQLLNWIVWANESSHALPFRTIVLFVSIYFVICIPLSLLGGEVSYRIHRRHSNSFPILSSLGSKFIKSYRKPPGVASRRPSDRFTIDCATILACGILPFAVIYVELQYLYKSVWLEKTDFYSLYGFLLANIILLCIVVCEVSFLGCYVMMRRHKKVVTGGSWRWKCFMMGTSCAWYMEVYSLYYILHTLKMTGFPSIFISVSYSLIFNIMCGCGMGSLGYLTSCWLVNRAYSTKYNALEK